MHAWMIAESFGLEHLRWCERARPTLAPWEVRVRVNAVSLNYRDLLMVKGAYNPRLTLPRIIGSDGAGTVVEVGDSVQRWRSGDRVMGQFMQGWIDGDYREAYARTALGGEIDGMLASEVILHENGLVRIPDHLSDVEASTLPCAAVTAWHAIRSANLQPGQTVLIQGTGGVSIFALQFAKLHGARVLGISGNDQKLSRALALGLDAGVNYRVQAEWDRWVRQQTAGGGVDLVIEVGGAGTLERSLRAVRAGGQIALIGVLAGTGGPLNLLPLLMRSVRLNGIFVGSRSMFESMNSAIECHRLRPIIDRVFPVDQAVEALRYLETAQHFGKVVIQRSESVGD